MSESLVFDPVATFWQQARLATEEGDLKRAAECLRKALRLAGTDHPSHGSLLTELGDTYFENRRYAKAIETWQKVLERPDREVDPNWIRWRLSRAFLKRRHLAQASATIERVKAKRNDFLLKSQIASTRAELLRMTHDYAAAHKELRKALRWASKLPVGIGIEVALNCYDALLEILRLEGDLKGAYRVLLEVREILALEEQEDELVGPFTDLGIEMIRSGRFNQAEKSFAAALACSVDPTLEVHLLSNYASILCEVGKYDEAYLFIQKAIAYADTDDPESPEFVASLYDTAGYICAHRKQFELALTWIQKALDRLNELPDSQFPISAVYLNQAIVYKKAGNPDRALMALYRAQEHEPGNKILLREIARLKRELENQ